jgi:hypothetical protein
VRRASLLVLTWCAGTTLAVVLALQGVALVDNQINDDRGSVGPPPFAEQVAPGEVDDSVAAIGTPITVAPATATATDGPATRSSVSPQVILVGQPGPPPTEPTTPEGSAQSAGGTRPRAAATTSTEPPATAAAETVPTQPAAPATTAPAPPPSTPTAQGDEDQERTETTRPRSSNRSQTTTTTTRPTTTTRRATTTTGVTTTTRAAAPTAPATTSRTIPSPGGTIGVVLDDGGLSLAFARPKSGFATDVIVAHSDELQVRFSSGSQDYRVLVMLDGSGQIVFDVVKG